MSKKLDGAIDALVDALAELPEHELEGWQRGNRLGLPVRACSALSGHHAADGADSPQVGLSALPAPLDHAITCRKVRVSLPFAGGCLPFPSPVGRLKSPALYRGPRASGKRLGGLGSGSG